MRPTCLNMIYELAKRDPRVVFIGSDLSPGLLANMKAEMPDRWFMEGVCEQNIIGMAAGLAKEGYMPFVNTIATFLTRRCYEQIAVDLCLHDLPVRLIGNGGGLIYAPLGPTHLAIEDMAILRALPNMTVVAPCDKEEVRHVMNAALNWPHPLYIRLGQGTPLLSYDAKDFALGRAVTLRPALKWSSLVLMTTGAMTAIGAEVCRSLADSGHHAAHLHFHTIKPLDRQAVMDATRTRRLVVTIEEGIADGGLGSAITDAISEVCKGYLPDVLRIGLPDSFCDKYGTQAELLEYYGLTAPQIVARILRRLSG